MIIVKLIFIFHRLCPTLDGYLMWLSWIKGDHQLNLCIIWIMSIIMAT